MSGTAADYYVYILECDGGRMYTGITVDVEKRFRSHNTGKGGAKFTRGFRPIRIKAIWSVTGGRGPAQKVEAMIKSMPRSVKETLAADPSLLKDLVSGKGITAEVSVCDLEEFIKKDEFATEKQRARSIDEN